MNKSMLVPTDVTKNLPIFTKIIKSQEAWEWDESSLHMVCTGCVANPHT